jgi:murein DD-endopeptidase MepM/ murein hydrolase activator NlpD
LKKVCLTVIIALLCISAYGTVQAVTSSDLEDRRRELQEQIAQSGLEIENIQIELTEALEKMNNLDKQIYDYEESIDKIDKELQEIEKNIKTKEKEITILQMDYERVKEAFADRIVYLYETNDTRYLDVLLSSKSIVEFISNYYLIGEMLEYDSNLIEKLDNNKEALEVAKQDLEKTKKELEERKTEKQRIAITLENSKIVKNSYVNSLTEQEKATKEKIETYQEELDLINLEMLLSSMENNDSIYVGGIFLWPTPGYYTITSPFGMRLHPILKTYRVHTGMDIGAPMGTYILAANSGVVSKATYSVSYGNLVMINHGNGISTAYAHGSEILVEEGQEVKRGDIIMKVGSTGWSTGPHLHFEIIVNGTKIDPYPYVTKTASQLSEDEQMKVQNKVNTTE